MNIQTIFAKKAFDYFFANIYEIYDDDDYFSREEAYRICTAHDVDHKVLLKNLGFHPEYNCHAVFEFLGY
jgi:hypothetical protein